MSMIAFTRQSAPSAETKTTSIVQLTHRTAAAQSGNVQDGIVHMQTYGFASAPASGCDHVVIYAEGDRSKGASIATNDQRYRPTGMAPGESQMHDNSGQYVYLQSGQKIILNAATEIDVQIGGTLVMKITASGVAVTGSITASGDITGGFGGSDAVQMQNHTHTYTPGSGSPAQTSGPVAGT